MIRGSWAMVRGSHRRIWALHRGVFTLPEALDVAGRPSRGASSRRTPRAAWAGKSIRYTASLVTRGGRPAPIAHRPRRHGSGSDLGGPTLEAARMAQAGSGPAGSCRSWRWRTLSTTRVPRRGDEH